MAYSGPSYIRATKGDSVEIKFTMLLADVPTALSTATVKAYEDANDTEFTGGITLTADYDGKTALNKLVVDTSNAAYTAGKRYAFWFSAGMVGAADVSNQTFLQIDLIPAPANLQMVNGGSTGVTAGQLELTQLNITTTGNNSAIVLDAQSGSGKGMLISTDTGNGIAVSVGSTNAGIRVAGGGPGIQIVGFGDDALVLESDDHSALVLTPGGTGKAISAALAELAQGVPAKNPSIDEALMLIYMALRNKVQVHKDTLLKEVYNDAGTRIAKKAISDDGTTYTEGKMSSGA